ncbi:MAG: apolipoprotein N-acyltransferase [Planctomycetota bacterium]
MKNISNKNISLICLAFIATAFMLTMIQAPFSWSLLAWVALVPFILVCQPAAKLFRLIVVSFAVSLVYWLGNLYWLVPVTVSGWIAFCLYTALLWPALAFAIRFCRTKKLPLFLVVPILFVAAERLQGLFLGGFLWRLLAHSQYENIAFIQIADIFGAAGVSFLVAMVNGLIAELIIAAREKTIFKFTNFSKIAVVAVLFILTFVYGRWRIGQSPEFVQPGPLVGTVQSNIPQSVKVSSQSSQMIFDQLMTNSKAAALAGVDLIAWPETMVQATLTPELLKLLSPADSYVVFDKLIRQHSKDNCFVLVGAPGGYPVVQPDLTIRFAKKYNSAFLYKPDGTKDDQQYNKIHLVPFGEVVPFKKNWPWLYGILMKFTPYDYDYTLDYGTEYTIFEIRSKKAAAYKFGVLICYEDVVPYIGRKFALDDSGQKKIDWLVNISNDGWFVSGKDDEISASTELSQHTAICVFRAIENRLSVLRSVNTGVSCLIDSLGRIKEG